MTCVLALETGNPEDVLPVSSYAARQPKVHMGVQKGEYYRMEDLLYGLMLESYNDAAVVIAEYYGSKAAGLSMDWQPAHRGRKQEGSAYLCPGNE